MQRLSNKSVARSRFNTMLLPIFAFVALALAAVGTYGVTSYAVTQRTREFGIRMALGAGAVDNLKLVLRRAIGLAFTFSAVPLSLIAIALLASYIPARRATKVNPLVALRYE